ncbi:hypothetical protein VPFG_00228 [Vibrio phage nt-1]|uniref:Uncharacterized protein n=1 Tax=Vibrio phage nt-1 TaxID=115992 RepID=R9TJF7_9CAUD|nr:hypothetical protein VPFG_00228 [Vibrio phage nt-1]AGN30227.1 hypothetical protein VPFG_00228 [Vibrio phage nt-1]
MPIPSIVGNIAADLLEDTELLSDSRSYTCFMLEDKAYNHVEHKIDLIEYIHISGIEFILAIRDGKVKLPFELDEDAKRDLNTMIADQYAGAFVHVLAADDMEKFHIIRSEWLKFLAKEAK